MHLFQSQKFSLGLYLNKTLGWKGYKWRVLLIPNELIVKSLPNKKIYYLIFAKIKIPFKNCPQQNVPKTWANHLLRLLSNTSNLTYWYWGSIQAPAQLIKFKHFYLSSSTQHTHTSAHRKHLLLADHNLCYSFFNNIHSTTKDN